MSNCFESHELIGEALRQSLPEQHGRRAPHRAHDCDACAQRVSLLVHALRHAHEHSSGKPATPCLDDNQIAELVDGVATPFLRNQAEDHLSECHNCRRQLRDLVHMLADLPVKPSAFEYVVSVARQGLRMLLHPEGGFALAPLQAVPALRPGLEHGAVRWTQQLGGGAIECSLHHIDDARMLAHLRQSPAGTSAWRIMLHDDETLLHAESLLPEATLELELEPGKQYRVEVQQDENRHELMLHLQVPVE